MDEKTLALAVEYKMGLTHCIQCGQQTLYIPNLDNSNFPMTCGRLTCGEKAGEIWAKVRK